MHADRKSPSDPSRNDLLTPQRLRQVVIVLLLALLLYGVYRILQPFLHAIVLAALLAYLFMPVHRWLLRLTRQRANVSAFATCLAVALVVLIPLAALTSTLVYQGVSGFRQVQTWFADRGLQEALETSPIREIVNSPPVVTVVGWQQRFFPEWTLESTRDWLVEHSGEMVSWFNAVAAHTLRSATGVLLSFALMLFVMFYCLRDGPRMLEYLARLSPLSTQQEQLLLARVQAVSRSAIMGTLITGVAQGALAMIAFAVAGIPWLLWGVMLGFASFIPIVGTALVWVPCVLYLLVIGKVGMAIGLAIWCIVVVGLVDNLLRPWLMQGQTGMTSVVLFFAILGGIQLFGLPGVIYGPLILGLCAALFYILDLELGAPPPRRTRAPMFSPPPAPPNGDAPEGDFSPRPRRRNRHRNRDRRRDGDDRPPRMSTDSGPY